ncbi:ferrochelatase [Limisphaera ngatamarikiensis]|uniref:Ferrochelatase n=1 Tax=Limisphaera ngatamarikiensis TaxID=1324935 RepID=A0A6M1RHL1_9BACT|nr:ferrochelatase [Limisphaera ngatamarikiensis]NGO39548.1 ferrochelatase [Limisphaera ngatamarikiensis]
MNPAVLLVNLGSPDSPSVPDVRRYLNEFLMDPRVIDVPWLLRRWIVGMILIRRPKQSAHAYQTIWTPEGSPLIVISRNVQKKLRERLGLPVELAMRYQNPSIPDTIHRMARQGIDRVHLIPLFPHYAMSSYETAVVRVQEVVARQAPHIRLTVEPPYPDHPDYIRALIESARPWLEKGFDHLLFSFHGVPERQIRKTDPTRSHCLIHPDCCHVPSPAHATCYRHQCFRTAELFAQQVGLPKDRWSVAFQSRLGRDPWLRPYTDEEIARLARSGIQRLLVICPAFVSDCLETLEEIGIRGRETFLEAGGREYAQIPCLNEHPLWIEALERMARRGLADALQNPQSSSDPGPVPTVTPVTPS